MTIKVPWRGILEITGDHDVGKTIAALQTTNSMKDVVFIDDDVKGDGTVRQMKDAGMDFDLYIDLSEARAKLGKTPTPDELLQHVVLSTIEKINEKRRKIIVWDTWRIVYQACRGHVERNQAKYSSVVTWRGNSTIIQGLISKVARMIEVKILNELKSNCDLLIITHHIKDKYVEGVVIGKVPESSATFDEVCNMRIWLRRNQQSKVPVMLFLKRPNVPKLVKGELVFQNIVPLKITPTDKHNSIWAAIDEYIEKPIESRAARPDETPTADELQAISGTLTIETRAYIKSMLDYQKMMAKELEDISLEASEQERIGTTETEKASIDSSTPSNGVQLLSRAKIELGYNLDDIQEIIGKSFAKINEAFSPEYWNVLLKAHDKQIAAMISGNKEKSKAKKK